jgi:hypothetical protein
VFPFPGYLSHETDLFTYLHPFNTTTLIKPMSEEEDEAPLEDPACPPESSCPGEARSRFKENKYGLKKLRDFIVSKGHGYNSSPFILEMSFTHGGFTPSKG